STLSIGFSYTVVTGSGATRTGPLRLSLRTPTFFRCQRPFHKASFTFLTRITCISLLLPRVLRLRAALPQTNPFVLVEFTKTVLQILSRDGGHSCLLHLLVNDYLEFCQSLPPYSLRPTGTDIWHTHYTSQTTTGAWPACRERFPV